jgi:hypothetical protein
MTDFLTKLDELREKAAGPCRNTDEFFDKADARGKIQKLLINHADEIAELVRAAEELHRLKILKVEIERRMETEGDVMSETTYEMRCDYENRKEDAWAELDETLAALNKEKS